jgi:hypothetical protein
MCWKNQEAYAQITAEESDPPADQGEGPACERASSRIKALTPDARGAFGTSLVL